jgi:thiol-disulfide isomerase/thioredoxin
MKRLILATACALILTGASGKGSTSLQPVLAARVWINGQATSSIVAGKVVVVDVFTVDCYNCQNVVPELRTLYAHDRVRGLAIVDIHAPETPPERDRAYVDRSLQRQGIVWPVAIDNSFALWNDYGVQAWPTQLIFDRHGRLRQTVVGDSQDAVVGAAVEELLAEK